MKITPLDIRRKEFRRSMRGYSDEEVDIFLDEVADEFERLFQENLELQDRVQRAEEQIATYAQVRDALEKTLVSAQVQSEEIKANALRESELILRDAQLKARSIVNDSYDETQQVQKTLVGLKRLEEEFRFKFRSLLEGYLNLLSEAPITTTAAAGGAALGGDMTAAPLAAAPAAAAVEVAAQPVPEAEAVPEAVPPEAEVVAGAETPEAVPAQEPSWGYEGEIEEEVPTEETEVAVAEAEPVEVAVAEAEPVEVAVAVTEPVQLAVASVETAAEAAGAPEAIELVEEMVPPEVPDEIVAQAESAVAAAGDTTATDEVTLETSAGRARPEDDQTGLDDSRHGFFFGRQLEDIDDTFPGEDVIRKDRTRDFEW